MNNREDQLTNDSEPMSVLAEEPLRQRATAPIMINQYLKPAQTTVQVINQEIKITPDSCVTHELVIKHSRDNYWKTKHMQALQIKMGEDQSQIFTD